MKNQLEVTIGQYSDKGRKEINQDFHDIRIPNEPQLTNKGIAIAIADGISSSQVSKIASKVSVTSFLTDYFSTPEPWSVKKSAERVLNATNSWLYSQSRQSQYRYDKDKGYVCTFSAMVIRSTTAYIFHVGDTRIYRLRDNTLEQLTEDHRLWVSKEQSYLSRALGIDSKINTDYEALQVEEDDVFFYMTDGVYEHVSDELLIDSIDKYDDFDIAAKAIVDLAYNEGSTDNLTVQIIKVDSLPDKNISEIQKQLAEKPIAPILEARMMFDGYQIVRELSASSRSHVYLAVDIQTDTSVVIKTPSIDMQDDQAYLERFMMEEWIARRINNANVVKTYEQTRKRNYLYSVTEFVDGQTLTQWMIDNPNPTIEMVRDIAQQIGKGLYAFHRLDMIHQDIRPENIIIDKTGTVKIIDFGSTRVEGIMDISTYIQQEHLQGTALYSAPEYFIAQSGTSRSDIFSLAIIVYQMLSGKFPYGVKVARATTKSDQKKLNYRPIYSQEKDIPLWIDEALRKALQIDPHKRYAELSEFLYDLRHPNKSYLNRTKAPLLERNPILFWQTVALVLAITNAILLLK